MYEEENDQIDLLQSTSKNYEMFLAEYLSIFDHSESNSLQNNE